MTAWTLTQEGARTLLTPAHGCVRWDISVSRPLPATDAVPRFRRRLATQVRQDVWRAVARVPGFVPLVSVEAGPDAITLTAGGCLRARRGHRPTIEAAIAAALDNPQNRTRWLAHAARRSHRREKPCSRRS